MTDQEALDEAKQRYLVAKRDIAQLRLKIAHDTCPIKVGDRVEIDHKGKKYSGEVELISDAPNLDDFLEPKVGAETPWTATGRRFKKDSSNLSKWTFSVTSHDEFKNGVWYKKVQSIETALGLI